MGSYCIFQNCHYLTKNIWKIERFCLLMMATEMLKCFFGTPVYCLFIHLKMKWMPDTNLLEIGGGFKNLLGLGLTLLPSFNVSGLHMICMIMQRQHQVSRFIGNVDSNVTQTPSWWWWMRPSRDFLCGNLAVSRTHTSLGTWEKKHAKVHRAQ